MIVLVSGSPGAGKSTLARQLAPKLGLALVCKDDLKEALFDSLGWSDREWSMKIGSAVWDVLFMLIDQAARDGASIMVESNFHKEHREKLDGLDLIEVHCVAGAETLVRRIRERDRHPGHVDDQVEFDGEAMLALHQPVADRVIRVDTNDGNAIDVDGIVQQIREAGS